MTKSTTDTDTGTAWVTYTTTNLWATEQSTTAPKMIKRQPTHLSFNK